MSAFIITFLIGLALLAMRNRSYQTAGFSDANINRYRETINKAAGRYGVPAEIIGAIIWQESRGNPMASGADQEVGLMQITPVAARDLYNNRMWFRPIPERDAHNNIMQGAAFLALQYRRAGSWKQAIRAYNAGYSATQKSKNIAIEYLNDVTKKSYQYGLRIT